MAEHKLRLVGSQMRFRELLGDELFWLWDRAADLSVLVDEACAGDRAKLHMDQFMRSHVWLGHRLLQYSPINNHGGLSYGQSIAYLGLVTFIGSFMCGLNRHLIENTLLSRQIRDVATRDTTAEVEDMLLWLLYIGAVVTLQDSAHDAWLLPQTSHLMEVLELDSWDDTKRLLSKFPWVGAFIKRKVYHYSTGFIATEQRRYQACRYPDELRDYISCWTTSL